VGGLAQRVGIAARRALGELADEVAARAGGGAGSALDGRVVRAMTPADRVGGVTRELAVAVGWELGRLTCRLNDADVRAVEFDAQVNELGNLLIALAADVKALAARVGKQG